MAAEISYELYKEDFVECAEQIIRKLHEGKYDLTTSKIRKILAMTNAIDALLVKYKPGDSRDDIIYNFRLLKMRIAYEKGRDTKEVNGKIVTGPVADFIEEADFIDKIDKIIKSNCTDKEFKKMRSDYCRFTEALVAYHKYYGGKN